MIKFIALILMGYVATDMFIELIGLIRAYREKKRKEEEQEHQWYVERCANFADRLTAEYVRIENLNVGIALAEDMIAKKVAYAQKMESLLAAELEKKSEDK